MSDKAAYGLAGSIVRGQSQRFDSSLGLRWKGFGVEHHLVLPGPKEETPTDLYVVAIAAGKHASYGQRANARRRFEGYVKEPQSVSIFPGGVLPAITPATDTELIVCAFEQDFVAEIARESDIHSVPEMPMEEGVRDPAIVNLGNLLVTEARTGGASGTLYADHVAHAFVLRLLSLWRLPKRSTAGELSIPRISLRRVLERMHTNPETDWSLASLAEESGFSRNHFIRMFRSSTGVTPHRYLLQLRVERAKAMLRNSRVRLIDIAASCGFSSEAHLSRAFRGLLGTTPSEYRRDILQ
jgi:AraC family transcriptional regulator